MFQRLKSTDFPQACLGMYYFAKGRHAHKNAKAQLSKFKKNYWKRG